MKVALEKYGEAKEEEEEEEPQGGSGHRNGWPRVKARLGEGSVAYELRKYKAQDDTSTPIRP